MDLAKDITVSVPKKATESRLKKRLKKPPEKTQELKFHEYI